MPVMAARSGFSFQQGGSEVEEYCPKGSHPNNPLKPLAPLLTPFTMMKKVVPSKATAQVRKTRRHSNLNAKEEEEEGASRRGPSRWQTTLLMAEAC